MTKRISKTNIMTNNNNVVEVQNQLSLIYDLTLLTFPILNNYLW